MIFPAHWSAAARALGIDLDDEHLIPAPTGRRYSHAIVSFRLDEHRDWASTSMWADEYPAESAEKKFGLPPGSVHGDPPWRHVSLNPVPIPSNDFRVRYPDVPIKRAHEFVLLHELGHVFHGWTEQAADDYAFARALLLPARVAAEKRALWYSKMKSPLDRFTR